MSRRRVPLGRPATWEDLERLPDDVIGEIVAGDLITRPRPGAPHARTTSDLGILLGAPFRFGIGGPGGWVILDEPYLRLEGDVRAPDLAGWRADRFVGVPDRGPIELVPDWICEVLSRSTEWEDRSVKLPLYARCGVRHLWLISPPARTLEAYRLERERWLLVGTWSHDARVRAEPFDAVELDLSLLWHGAPPEDEDG